MILPTKQLREALQKVAPAAPKSAITPILEHVWIESDGKKVSVKLSNLRETIETSFETSERNKKEIILPHYGDLMSYAKLVREVDIELKQIEGSVEIKAGKAKSRINGEESENYPKIPEVGGEEIELPLEYLHDIKVKILPFASTDELRPAMTGAMLKAKAGNLIMEATDGHTLARIETKTDLQDCEILFRREIPEIATSLFEGENVSTWIDGNSCKITDGNSTLTSRLIDERFPDTDGVLPPKVGEITRADRQLLLSEMQKAKLFTNDKEKLVKLTFTPKHLDIVATDIDFDKSFEDRMEVEGCKELLIGLDVDNVIKAAQKIEGDEIEIHHYNAANKAIVIREDDYMILIMPMMIK